MAKVVFNFKFAKSVVLNMNYILLSHGREICLACIVYFKIHLLYSVPKSLNNLTKIDNVPLTSWHIKESVLVKNDVRYCTPKDSLFFITEL